VPARQAIRLASGRKNPLPGRSRIPDVQ